VSEKIAVADDLFEPPAEPNGASLRGGKVSVRVGK
jgi:hypothetical protein